MSFFFVSVMNKVSRRVGIVWPILKHPNEKHGNEFFPREGLLYQSDYFMISRPILWMGFFVGRIPYNIRSGWIRFSYKSLQFAYAFFLALVNWFFLFYYREHLINTLFQVLGSKVSFSSVLFSMLIFIQPFATIVIVYSWVFEVPLILKGYNSTAILEKKISNVFSTYTRKPFNRNLVTVLMSFAFIGILIIAYFLISTRFSETPTAIILLLVLNVDGTFSHCFLWCFNCYFISDLASKLNKHMLLCLKVNHNCAFRIKTCRKIWILIWKQSQSYSHSIAITISYTLIVYGMIFIVGCYGTLASVRNHNILEILEMSPYVVETFVVITCIFETSYQATHKLGVTFLNTMIILDKDALDPDCVEEIEKFIDTINRTRIAVITLKDYMMMDRTLIISFLSYSITYLIVLLQFQGKNQEVVMGILTPIENNTNLFQ